MNAIKNPPAKGRVSVKQLWNMINYFTASVSRDW